MSFGLNFWLALAGYVCVPLAWWAHRCGRKYWPMLLLALCAWLLRMSASLDPCLHEWDERYHALVAKHLIDHPFLPTLYDDPATPHDPGSWVLGHVWLNKPPLPLWLIAGSINMFGLEGWAVRLPSALLSGAAVLLLFALARDRWSSDIAFWAAMLFAINGHLIELASGRTSNDHPDTFLIGLVLASLFAASRMAMRDSWQWAAVAGISLGAAFLSKSWPALIVLPVAACFLWSNRGLKPSRRAVLLGLLLFVESLVAVPWSLHTLLSFPEVAAAASDAHWRHFSEGLEGHARPWYYYFVQVPMIHGELVPLALLWFIVVALRGSGRENLGLAVWIALPYAIFSFAETKMPAYVAISAPAWCMLIAMTVHAFWSARPGRTWWHWGLRGLAIVLIVLPLRFSWSRSKPLEQAVPTYVIPEAWQHAGPRTIVLDCPFPIELMFHTGIAAAYDHALDQHVVERLEQDGFTVVPFE